jgi:hypothetical protein
MFIKTPKQCEAIDVLSSNLTTLLEGGSRSGKSAIIIYAMLARALKYPGSMHLMARLHLSHAKVSLWMNTVPYILDSLGLKGKVKINNSDFYMDIGIEDKISRIWCAGLDDGERMEKILGTEFATIFINEASQISFNHYEILKTRLNAPKGVMPRFWLDQNPGSMSHFTYKVFHDRKFPDGSPVPANDYGVLKMNPTDNKENLNESYITMLEGLSGSKRRRFLEGCYGTDDIGALWKREWIRYKKPPETLVRVVIAVDPSGTVDGDEVGIIAIGKDAENKLYVLGDYSMNGTPQQWATEVKRVYDLHAADVVVAEKNYGGDMVASTITGMGSFNINCELVNASRGKAIRAEPISAMYERGEVFHSHIMIELEDELCQWKSSDKESPNHLDSLVWGATALTEDISNSNLDYV